MTTILWFRQDLRLSDNPALCHAAANGPVIPVYIRDETDPLPLGGASLWWLHHSLAALRDEPNATAELSQLMKELSRLQARRRAWGARALAAIVGLVLGGLLAVGARPAGLLDGASRSVPKKQDVLSQIFHAKQADTRDAWLAVYDYFAPLDPSLELLADQGLVRFYLRQQRYSAARQLCWDIYDKAGDQQPEARQLAFQSNFHSPP